jgi:uncharacterized protein (DUF1501 family)
MGDKIMDLSRRHFLRMAGYGLGGVALTNMIEKLSLGTALAQGSDYRALVCIFMGGGNDSNNMVIPYDSGNPDYGYQVYAESSGRRAASLAIHDNDVNDNALYNTSTGRNTLIAPPAMGGMTFGLHPNMKNRPQPQDTSSLWDLWNQGKVAVLCNTGPLVVPLTRDQYLHPDPQHPKPYQLFSHSDQQDQWQSTSSIIRSQSGWGGRTSDLYAPDPSGLPMLTTIAGLALFTLGVNTRPLSIQPAPSALNTILRFDGFGNTMTDPERSRRNALVNFLDYDRSSRLVAASADATKQAIQIANALNSDPVINTVFPNTGIGNQLKQVAKVIKANLTTFHLPKQIFFCSFGGFDTHQNEIANQGNLMTQLSQAMGAFYDTTANELMIADKVTTFTLSDFSRTMKPAGSGGSVGSDHAWGSHQLIMGGAVNRGNPSDFYGMPHANGTVFNTLRLGVSSTDSSVDDADSGNGARGRWIPKVSVDQYGATLCAWLGVPDSQLDVVFPQLHVFNPNYRNLGFV